jgi:hypothetical protein
MFKYSSFCKLLSIESYKGKMKQSKSILRNLIQKI